ncbi:MAG: phosphoribosyltransferase family protein [Clostridiales bacterium]|nr:phosphoribosyltransferase family protein [Clostridiales bacterium]
MKLNDELNKLSRGILDFFFPRRCPFCGAVAGKELLCKKCLRSLPFTGEHAVREGTFGRCAAPLYYEDRVREAILQFKFKAKLGGLSCFGMLMAECAAEHYSGAFDAITWVPVSKKRLKKRGFDQTRYLTGSMCVDWHVAPIETLRKVTDNPPQSTLETEEQRRANVLGVYEAVNAEQFRGKRLLLVDDILTTGATLSECVRVLKEAGAGEVMCLTLAMSREKK